MFGYFKAENLFAQTVRGTFSRMMSYGGAPQAAVV